MFNIYQRLSWSTSLQLFSYFDHKDNFRNVYQIRLGPSFDLTKSASIYFVAQMKDRTVSTNSFLDDENTMVELGVTYAF